MPVLAVDDVLEDGQSLGIIVTEHQHAGVVSGGSAAGCTALGPFTTFIARRKQGHGLNEVGLDLVEDHVLGNVLSVHGLNGRVLGILGEKRDFLIISGEMVICQGPQEQGLSLDTVHCSAAQSVVRNLGQDEVAAVHHVEVVTPGPLVADIDLAGGVEIVIREIPLLRSVPHLVAADCVQRVSHAGEGTLQTDSVVAGYERLLEV